MAKKYIRVWEACERWGIGKTTVFKFLREQKLVAVRPGKRLTLIDVDHGDAFFASLQQGANND